MAKEYEFDELWEEIFTWTTGITTILVNSTNYLKNIENNNA